MYRRSDPRFRRTLNELSHTLESANESAQANVYSFSQHYLSPCLSSLSACFNSCTAPCCTARDQRRRSRARSRGRAELSFDFYDDWEEEEEDAALLGWGNDEYDGLLGPSQDYGTTTTQPGRQRAMSYGARRANRRRSHPGDVDDPTVIPASSYWGFFGKLTGKIGGGKSLRYKPSAADLQEHPGSSSAIPEGEPLLEEEEEEEFHPRRRHKRTRSNTQSSGNTTDSLSSRGDIFPSEDELDDAVPLDDEFAMVLERRTTNSGLDDMSSGKKGKRPSAGSRLSTRTMSSRSSRNSKRLSRTTSSDSAAKALSPSDEPKNVPSMAELKQEEIRLRKEEDAIIAHRREAAERLAGEIGLASSTLLAAEEKSRLPSPDNNETSQKTPTSEPTTPFPAFDPPPMEAAPPTEDHDTANDNFNPAQLPRLSR